MNKTKISILLAMALGDGLIRRRINPNRKAANYSITIKHSIKQKEYLEYKASLINSALGGRQNEVKYINNNGYLGCCYSKGGKELGVIYKLLYSDNKKKITRKALEYLTPQGIAIWYMDDGSLYAQRRNGRVHAYQMVLSTYCEDIEEAQDIINYFIDTWNIKFNIKKNKNRYSLTCNTKEIRKFIEIVKPYVSKIKCMTYKIDRITNN